MNAERQRQAAARAVALAGTAGQRRRLLCSQGGPEHLPAGSVRSKLCQGRGEGRCASACLVEGVFGTAGSYTNLRTLPAAARRLTRPLTNYGETASLAVERRGNARGRQVIRASGIGIATYGIAPQSIQRTGVVQQC